MKRLMTLLFIAIRGIAQVIAKLCVMAVHGSHARNNSVPEYRSARMPVVSQRVLRKYKGLEAVSGKPQILQAADFEVADQIVAIRFDPPVGVVHMRVFSTRRVIKRDLIIHEPVLKGIMKGRRFNLPDAVYNPADGLELVKDETVALAENLINEVGNRNVRAIKPPKREAQPQAKPAPDKAEQPKDVIRSKPEATRAPDAETPRPREIQVAKPSGLVLANQSNTVAPQARVFAPKLSMGLTYVGQLQRSQHRMIHPKGRDPYETYEATILMDNGAEMPMRGAELEREIEQAGCKVGDHVAITPMGKVPVTLVDGREGSKNLYKVERLESR